MTPFVTRFAPSPTGYLHKGHGFSALAVQAAAREAGGRLLLRIEDIDTQRCRPAFEAAIYDDLAWLGLDWEKPVRRQSEHMPDYAAALQTLRRDGLLYRCFRTRQDVLDEIARAPHGPVEAFTGAALPAPEEAARVSAGEPFAWRLSLSAARAHLGARWDALTFTDIDRGVIAARPASVGDDALQGVTHVVRGEDLAEAAHIHRLLQALLDLPEPLYRHHRLLTGPDGKKFSKRDHAQSLREIRESGVSPERLRTELGF